MNKILWISPIAPYNGIANAGGKNENFYLKKVAKEHEVRMISCCTDKEVNKLDLDKYGIKNDIYVYKLDLLSRVIRNIRYDGMTKYNPFDRYANFVSGVLKNHIINTLKKLKKEGYTPDCIILQWTQCVLLIDDVKRFYPNACYVAIEEDVSFLNFYRRISAARSNFEKKIKTKKYIKLKNIELEAIQKTDLAVCNNNKDCRLLCDNGIEEDKLTVVNVYSQNYSNVKRKQIDKNKIMFFGAMERVENYESVIWFIQKVMPKLDKKFVFYVVGAHPPKQIESLQSDNVKIVGFVDDVGEYFADSLCMVVPLHLGAGIKVKVLEALSAGVPVLTTSVGIEGIPATNGKDYIFCESPEEYVNAINKLHIDEIFRTQLSLNSSLLYAENYDADKSAKRFCEKLNELGNN